MTRISQCVSGKVHSHILAHRKQQLGYKRLKHIVNVIEFRLTNGQAIRNSDLAMIVGAQLDQF